MKRLILYLLLLNSLQCLAQKDTSCTMDMYGCYVYTLRSLINGAELKKMHDWGFGKKTKTVYIPQRFYTAGLPEKLDGVRIQYIDLNTDKDKIYDAVKNKKAALYYLSELNITATKCDLWLMPIGLKKTGDTIEPDYTELGCHVSFKVCGENGKLGYDNTICP